MQLKRGLDGFWVAHPAFVRPGIALVAAWRAQQRGEPSRLAELVRALVPDPSEHPALLQFVAAEDVAGLEPGDPLYPRRVLAADIDPKRVPSNADDAEVAYNIFQALQYLADWLSGNGCVALPALLRNANGKDIFVRVHPPARHPAAAAVICKSIDALVTVTS